MASVEALALKAERHAERQTEAANEIAARLARIEEKLGIPAWKPPVPAEVNAMGEPIKPEPVVVPPVPAAQSTAPKPNPYVPVPKPPLIPDKGDSK